MIFNSLKKEIEIAMTAKPHIELPATFEEDLIQSNPEYYQTYTLLGDYFRLNEDCEKAKEYYERAKGKEIPTLAVLNKIEGYIEGCE